MQNSSDMWLRDLTVPTYGASLLCLELELVVEFVKIRAAHIIGTLVEICAYTDNVSLNSISAGLEVTGRSGDSTYRWCRAVPSLIPPCDHTHDLVGKRAALETN